MKYAVTGQQLVIYFPKIDNFSFDKFLCVWKLDIPALIEQGKLIFDFVYTAIKKIELPRLSVATGLNLDN
jgi:hypothetical protein